MSCYNRRQIQLAKWDQKQRKFRKHRTTLKKLRLKGQIGTLVADSNGCVTGWNEVTQANLYLGRIYLDEELDYNNVNINQIIDVIDWQNGFETTATSLLQDNHHFTVPSTLNGLDVTGATVYVLVQAQLNLVVLTDPFANGPITQLGIRKNGSTVVATGSHGTMNDDNDIFFELLTITVNDIVPCQAGDTLDLFISVNDEVKVTIEAGTANTFATFTILRVDNPV